MKWLQAAVVIMGIMIITGLIVIGVTIAHRLSAHHLALQPTDTSLPGDLVVRLPSAAHVIGVSSVGDDLVLRVAGADQQEWLYIVDPQNGRVVSHIKLDNH